MDTPITVIEGARQVGKSTLLKQIASERTSMIVSLEEATASALAQRDPVGFVRQFPEGTLMIDEIQQVPSLILALKAEVDRDRRPG